MLRRVYEHKIKFNKGFTQKYGVDKLGYYEMYDDVGMAIVREKELKAGNRKRKIELIESINLYWIDLYYHL